MKRFYDYGKLRGKIREVYGTQSAFAREIKVSDNTLSCKLNNYKDWKQEEIEDSIEKLGIPCECIPLYFFNKKVENISSDKTDKKFDDIVGVGKEK